MSLPSNKMTSCQHIPLSCLYKYLATCAIVLTLMTSTFWRFCGQLWCQGANFSISRRKMYVSEL